MKAILRSKYQLPEYSHLKLNLGGTAKQVTDKVVALVHEFNLTFEECWPMGDGGGSSGSSGGGNGFENASGEEEEQKQIQMTRSLKETNSLVKSWIRMMLLAKE